MYINFSKIQIVVLNKATLLVIKITNYFYVINKIIILIKSVGICAVFSVGTVKLFIKGQF